MRKATRLYTPEVLMVKCINGDVREYKTKVVTLAIEGCKFRGRVGVIPQLDCPVLIG